MLTAQMRKEISLRVEHLLTKAQLSKSKEALDEIKIKYCTDMKSAENERNALKSELESAQSGLHHREKELSELKRSMELFRKTSEQVLDDLSEDRDSLKSETLTHLAQLETDCSRMTGEKSKLEMQLQSLAAKLEQRDLDVQQLSQELKSGKSSLENKLCTVEATSEQLQSRSSCYSCVWFSIFAMHLY
eukprot:GHVH01016823.1.p1 GENE.GHVH01016823.1~~GHVH01016823.1.p1  ORF type:complete len:189 (+),score=30.23 GHVH01016823.1:165-731(+)